MPESVRGRGERGKKEVISGSGVGQVSDGRQEEEG